MVNFLFILLPTGANAKKVEDVEDDTIVPKLECLFAYKNLRTAYIYSINDL